MSLILLVLLGLPSVQGYLTEQRFPPKGDPALAEGPDIFILLLDGFGRQDVLAESYGHDASPFIRQLQDRGFEVATASRSNHATTGLALTTMLNARHFDDLGFTAASPPTLKDLHPVLENNRAFRTLADAGYDTIAFSSGYELVSLRSANRFIDTGELNELEVDLIGQTTVGSALGMAGNLKTEQTRNRAHAIVPALAALAGESSIRPRFVLVHFPLPHPPYVLGPGCEPVQGGEPIYVVDDAGVLRKPPDRLAEEIRLTADQVKCTELLAISMVDSILASTAEDTVLVVMSDHGPATRLDSFRPRRPAIDERLASFFAARVPGRPGFFPNDITPVNIMSLLLNEFVGAELPIQPNTSYFDIPGQGLVALDEIPR